MHWIRLRYLATASVVLLAVTGCGTGDNDVVTDTSNTSGATTGLYKLSGTVPGTIIEAFCENGYYQQVGSEQNGAAEHPFSISLPTNSRCQVVMTMNETDVANKTVTPVGFSGNQIIGFAISAEKDGADIDIGFVDLPTSPTDPKMLDSDGDHIRDEPLSHTLPDLAVQQLQVHKEAFAVDPDADGIPNHYDADDDNDGIPDRDDDDDDGDGIADSDERDRDWDGVDDRDDVDDDNDGVADDDELESDIHVGGTVTFSLPQTFVPDTTGGRLLAAQCAQCHGTNGYSVSGIIEGLVGEAGELAEEMAEMRAELNTHIMNAQAKGYSPEEVTAMAGFFQKMAAQYGSSDGDAEYDRDDD